MSYYNYMFIPSIDIDNHDENEDEIFWQDENGWEFLVKSMGEEFVLTDTDGKKFMLFKEVEGGTDAIRPRDLNWQWHDRETFYNDADCFIFVHDLHNRIDWANVKDIEVMERSIGLYQNKIKKYGNKLIILPI